MEEQLGQNCVSALFCSKSVIRWIMRSLSAGQGAECRSCLALPYSGSTCPHLTLHSVTLACLAPLSGLTLPDVTKSEQQPLPHFASSLGIIQQVGPGLTVVDPCLLKADFCLVPSAGRLRWISWVFWAWIAASEPHC